MSYPQLAMMIDGAWVQDGLAGAKPVVDPATGENLGDVPLADASQLDAAIAAADRAFGPWRRTHPRDRSRIVRAAADRIRTEAAALAHVMSCEQGKPIAEALAELQAASDALDWCAEEGRRTYGRLVPGAAQARQLVILEPVGPAVAFTPWNFPALTPARKIGAALAAGCPLILKAAEETPATAMALVRAFAESGLPAGVLQLVFGEPAFVSERLIQADAIRKVSFTGSVAVGKSLLRLASDGVKRTTMELGGHAPAIVFDDVDPVRAGQILAASKFRNAGQVCISPSRFYVQDAAFDSFLASFLATTKALVVGRGIDSGVTMGPLAHERRPQAMEAFIADAVERGGRVRTGGRRIGNAGYFFAPTVVTDMPDDSRLMIEEPFGPIAPITRFRAVNEVMERANSLPLGLASYAFTSNNARAMAVAEGLRAGMVGVNTLAVSTPETPFGGVGESGLGQEGGVEGLAAYLDVKFVAQAAEL